MKKMFKNKKGFTLIELIVVIAILGILAAIAVPRLIGFQDTARAQANKQTANQIKSAVAMGIANGEIRISTAAAIFYFKAIESTTSPGAIDIVTAEFNAGNFTHINGVTPATEANLETVITKYVNTFDLKTVSGLPQAVGVKINNTAVTTTSTNESTTAALMDYTLAD